MTSKEIYESIDQSKLSSKGREFLKSVEKNTQGFTKQNDKVDSVLKKLYADLKIKKPEALKDVTTKTVEKEVKVPTTKSEQKKEPKKKTKVVKTKVKKATGKKKNTKPTKTPSTPKKGKEEHISTRASKLAKKDGITFKEARAKLSKSAKEQLEKDEKETEKELDKLLKFVRKGVFEDGEKYPKTHGKQDPKGSSVSADAKRKAKPVGRRVSEKSGETTNQYGTYKNKTGRVYYESRDNRSDRNSVKAPKGQYKYKGQAPPYLEAGGEVDDIFEFTLTPKTSTKSKGKAQENSKSLVKGVDNNSKLENVIHYATAEDTKRADPSSIQSIRVRVFASKKDEDKIDTLADLYGFKVSSSRKATMKGNKFVYAEGGAIDSLKKDMNSKLDIHSEYYAEGGEIDLFEDYESQPKELSEIVEMYEERYADGDMDYESTKEFLDKVNAIGYTFDAGLDNEPYNLRPMMAKGGKVNLSELSDATYRMAETDKKQSKRLFEISDDLADLDLGNKTFAKGGRTISIVNDGVKFDKSKYKAVYGDFDNDGTVNIDDANPLDKSKAGQVEGVELRKTFDKLLGVKAELDEIMYDAVETLDEKAPKGADIYARTKTPYSILKKLVEKRMLDPKRGLTDMIGTTIAVDNQKELEKVRDDIDGGLLGKVLDRDDFYKTPNAGYMAYHYIVEYKGVPVEVQLKTKNMKKLHEVSHEAYKNGTLNAKSLDSLSKTFMRADKGDAKAKSEISKLLKDKKLLASKISKGSMAKGGKTDGDTLGDFKKRLLELGDKEFVEYKEKQLKKQDLYYAFKDRLKNVHKQTIVRKYDLPFEKGGEIDAFIMKFVKDAPASNLRVDSEQLTAKLKRGGKLGKKVAGYRDRMEAGGTLPTPFGQSGLVGETGTMNEVDLFAMGGGLPQGVHQYYAQTYNPAYPTPHGYAKGGEVDTTIAKTIIQQMGGMRRLSMFTGAKNFVALPNGVSFRIGNKSVNFVKIILNGKDLYDLTFGLMRNGKLVNKKEYNDIYSDQLKSIFEKSTGMYLSFEAGGTLPTPFGQAGLVGETGTMNEMDMFAMGGGLPQGVHQYYANTYNPAYPTPHGYAKGGDLDSRYSYDIEYVDSEGDEYNEGFDSLEDAKKEIKYLKENGYRITRKFRYLDDKYVGSFAKGGMTDVERQSMIDMGYTQEQIKEVEDNPRRGGRFAKGGLTDSKYIPSYEIYEVVTKDGKVYENDYSAMEFLSGAYVSDKVVTKEDDKDGSQMTLFDKGGKIPKGAIYIKRRDIDYITIGDEDDRKDEGDKEKVDGKKLFNGFWIDPKKQKTLIAEAKKDGRLGKSMAKGGKTKSSGSKRKTPLTLAKEIRKEGEKWQDAVKRASAILKKKAK